MIDPLLEVQIAQAIRGHVLSLLRTRFGAVPGDVEATLADVRHRKRLKRLYNLAAEELLEARGFGDTTLREVRTRLAELGLAGLSDSF
jgi:hypothetical protein